MITRLGRIRSVLAIPPIGAAESLPRLRGKGLRGAERRDATAGSALARDLERLQDRGAGGMAPLAARAPRLTLRRVGPYGRPLGSSARRRRRGLKEPKEGSRRLGAPSFPSGQPAAGGCSAVQYQRIGCAALLHVRRPASARRAPRAFKVVEEVLTDSRTHIVPCAG